MGLLDKLWDDVLAGPQPDRGLGRLRHDAAESKKRILERGGSADFLHSQDEARRDTQSIAIAKPSSLHTDSLEPKTYSPPSTPNESTPPVSPSAASPSGDYRQKYITRMSLRRWPR